MSTPVNGIKNRSIRLFIALFFGILAAVLSASIGIYLEDVLLKLIKSEGLYYFVVIIASMGCAIMAAKSSYKSLTPINFS